MFNKKSQIQEDVALEEWFQQADKDDPKIKEFKNITKKNPRDHNVYLDWARYIWCKKRLPEVIEKIKYAIELKPDCVDAYLSLGYALCEQGNVEESESQFNKALMIDPKSTEAYIAWGQCLSSNDQSEKALEKYKKAQEIDPNYPTLYFIWGLCLESMDQCEEAARKFEKYVTLMPSGYERLDLGYIKWGNCLYYIGKTKDAIDKYLKAIEIFPWNVRAFEGWSKCLREEGNLEDSTDILKSAIKIIETRRKWRTKNNMIKKVRKAPRVILPTD